MIRKSNLPLKTKFFNIGRKIFLLPLFERILKQLTQEQPFTSFIGKLVPNTYQSPENSFRIFERTGIQFKTDISDYAGHFIYFDFKNPSINKLFYLVNAVDTIHGIVTNIGYTLLNFAKLTGKQGHVVGFEPDQVYFSQCNKNIELNEFQNTEIHNLGLGHAKSQFNLYVDSSHNRSGNRILSDEKGIGKGSSTIQVITLGEWLAEHQPAKNDLIKIVTEGSELNVLTGAQNTLTHYSPVLFIEVDNTNLDIQGHSAKQVILFLLTIGDKVVRSNNNTSIDLSYNFTNCHFDVICRKTKK